MRHFEGFETNRTRLRRPAIEDASAIYEGWTSDSVVTKYLTWKPHTALRDSEGFLQHCLELWESAKATRSPYMIVAHEDDRVLGMVDIRLAPRRIAFGYVLARREWGKGIMTEVVGAVADAALALDDTVQNDTVLGEIVRVEATTSIKNIPSQRVLERAGFEREGILRCYMHHPNISDEPSDVYMYSRVE